MPVPVHSPSSVPPRVTVLLATHNGERWLGEQLDSILLQEGVELRVVALDDASTDSTPSLLAQRAAADPRLTVLPTQGASGSAAANFYRLILSLPENNGDLIAFADQDDIWMPDKLQRHAAILVAGAHDGISSDVVAFSADGSESLVRKSYPPRRFDYLFESPGPGCTFLLTPRLAELVRQRLAENTSLARSADFHDWLIYVLCRARGWGWHIDSIPSLHYRQHDSNAMGANVGTRQALSRLSLIRQRWHRHQATTLARVALEVAPTAKSEEIAGILNNLVGQSIGRRFSLLRTAGQFRRRPRDRAIITVLIALGIW